MIQLSLWAILLNVLPFFTGSVNLPTVEKTVTAPHAILRESPVVVELFSSEGCSSCPAADETMSGIIAEAKKSGKPVFIIDFHVDYFDRLGWKDSLASPEFSKRQYMYAETFKLTSAYTPQAIINGKKESSGSDDVKLNRLIHAEMKASPKAKIACTLRQDAANRSLEVSYKLAGNVTNCVINYALYEEKIVHDILKGENAGKTLSHNNVVRVFEQEDVQGSKGKKLLQNLPSGPFQLLVYVQNKTTLEILAAQQLNP